MAQRLIHLAGDLAGEARTDAIGPLVSSALQHLDQSDHLTREENLRAAGHSLAGFIHERFTGNRAAALASYEAAVRAAPNSNRYKETLERAQRQKNNTSETLPEAR